MSTRRAAFGSSLQIGDGNAGGATAKNLTAAVITAGTTARFTTSTPHGYVAGDYVRVAGVTPAGYNGDWVVSAVGSSTQFDANIGTSPGAGSVFGTVILLDHFTTVAQVRNLSGEGFEVDVIDVSTHDQANAVREKIAGMIEGGDIVVDLVFDHEDASQMAARTDLVNRKANRSFKILFPGMTDPFRFSGSVSKWGPSRPIDGYDAVQFTITPSGAPSWTT